MSATPELSQPRGPGRRFAPGRSGNPAGRPKGSRNKTTLLAEAMLAERLVKAGRVLDAGLAERQPWATRLVFNAFVPRPRAAGPEIDMPEIDGPADVAPASAAVLAAATSGLLTPTEAQAMHKVVEARAAMVGWAPPPPRPADAGRLTFGTISFRHTLPGDPGPLAFTVVDTVVRRDTDGSETRFRRVDTLTPAEIAAARASHRPDPDRPGGTWPPAESPAAEPAPALATDGAESPSDLAGETPAAPSLPADAPLSAPANAAGPEASNAAPVADTHTLPPEPARPAAPGAVPCIISENTASPSTGAAPAPDGPPGPAPAATPSDLPKHPGHIDAEKALAKWQAIAADESLPAHKREAATLEVLRYRRQVQSWDSMPPPPILVFEGEPPKRDPVALPERWPPPPRLIIVDTPPAWGRPELHHWLGQQGLQLHRSDEIRYRRPTRHPAILSVVRKPDATGDDFVARSSQSAGGPGDHGIAPENPLDLAQAFHGEAARTKTGGSS